jgi:tetratricopeptide (TPR) repeat protein
MVAGSAPPTENTVIPGGLGVAPARETWQQDRNLQTIALRQANKRQKIIVISIIALLVSGVVYWSNRDSAERKLEEAIENGNLLSPPGDNAYELYNQLKRDGASPHTLAGFNEKLLPLLTSRPQKVLYDFATPGSKEPTIAVWEDMSKRLSWASTIKPDDGRLAASASYCAGRIAYLNNRKDDALQLWNRAGDQDPSWAMPLNGVGLIYNERKDYSTARQYLYEAVRREPNWALPYNNLGTSFYYEKDYSQAELYYQKAVERAPRWARPHAWLGDIAMRQNYYDRAVEEFQLVLEFAQTEATTLDLGQIRQRLEQARQLASRNSQGGD